MSASYLAWWVHYARPLCVNSNGKLIVKHLSWCIISHLSHMETLYGTYIVLVNDTQHDPI